MSLLSMSLEKRTDRLELPHQLNVGEDLARTIRLRAAINDRTIQLEILHLIKVGIRADPVRIPRLAQAKKPAD